MGGGLPANAVSAPMNILLALRKKCITAMTYLASVGVCAVKSALIVMELTALF